jgi:hypothetical protein
MFRNALRAALPGKAKHLTEARFGVLELPLLDRLALSPREIFPTGSGARAAHRHSFLTTLVRLYRRWHTIASGKPGQNCLDHAGPAALQLVFMSNGRRCEVTLPTFLEPVYVGNTQWMKLSGSKVPREHAGWKAGMAS